MGEFGRTPKINKDQGRDHWGACQSALLAGGGVRGGQVYGASDRYGAHPQNLPVHPYAVVATLYHGLGINPETEYRDTLNRPRHLVEHGKPLLGLF